MFWHPFTRTTGNPPKIGGSMTNFQTQRPICSLVIQTPKLLGWPNVLVANKIHYTYSSFAEPGCLSFLANRFLTPVGTGMSENPWNSASSAGLLLSISFFLASNSWGSSISLALVTRFWVLHDLGKVLYKALLSGVGLGSSSLTSSPLPLQE